MALMVPQAISSVITPSLTTPTTSDTITPDSGLFLVVTVGATSTTITVNIPGNQPYSGAATTDSVVSAVTNTTRYWFLNPAILTDPATGLISVTYSQVTNVTSGLFKLSLL